MYADFKSDIETTAVESLCEAKVIRDLKENKYNNQYLSNWFNAANSIPTNVW